MDGINFALSYNGYNRHGGDEARRIMRTTNEQYRKSGEYPNEINTLRCTLFMEQRKIRWNEPHELLANPEYATYIDGLIEQIRHLSGGTVPGPPDRLP